MGGGVYFERKSIKEGLGAGSPEKFDPGNFEIDVLGNYEIFSILRAI